MDALLLYSTVFNPFSLVILWEFLVNLLITTFTFWFQLLAQ